MSEAFHNPVLLSEVLRYLPAVERGVYVDGTLGGGGYAATMMAALPAEARLVGFDLDADAINHARKRLHSFADRVTFVHDNFATLPYRMKEAGIDRIDCFLLDLGVSSHQIDAGQRGFSFRTDERLDMRMDRRQELDAYAIVNSYPAERLTEIFRTYGEERFSGRIARMIVRGREQEPIVTTKDLAAIVGIAVGSRFPVKSQARIFQAIRIEVNNELENLRVALGSAVKLMNPGGRLLVISYHSLEDRIVKQFIRTQAQAMIPSGNKLVPDTIVTPMLRDLTPKPVVPGDEEVRLNPRARSAKLRVAEKT